MVRTLQVMKGRPVLIAQFSCENSHPDWLESATCRFHLLGLQPIFQWCVWLGTPRPSCRTAWQRSNSWASHYNTKGYNKLLRPGEQKLMNGPKLNFPRLPSKKIGLAQIFAGAVLFKPWSEGESDPTEQEGRRSIIQWSLILKKQELAGKQRGLCQYLWARIKCQL